MDKVCFFDVNGTILDTSALDPVFRKVFGHALYRQIWFEKVLRTSQGLSLSGGFETFEKISENTLTALAASQEIDLDMRQKSEVMTTMAALPAYPDVRPSLNLLKDAGYRLAAFTNSSRATAVAQIEHAGLAGLFDRILSIEGAKAYKPSLVAYDYAAEEMGAKVTDCWLAAGHAWDTDGAQRAGLKGGLVLRPESGMNKCFKTPDAEGGDMVQLAGGMIQRDKSVLAKLAAIF